LVNLAKTWVDIILEIYGNCIGSNGTDKVRTENLSDDFLLIVSSTATVLQKFSCGIERRYTMKKLLIIPLFLLVFGSSCSFIERIRQPSSETGLAEPDRAEEFFWNKDREPIAGAPIAEPDRAEAFFWNRDREPTAVAPIAEPDRAETFFWNKDREPIAAAPIRAVRAPIMGERGPTPARPELVAMSESGTSIISRTYPWPECGIIRLDKDVPNEVEPDKPFDYSIKVTNLMDTTVTHVVITENLPDNFNFISANPTAQKDANKLMWEIESLGPKASRQITVSGTATHADSLGHYTTVVTPIIPAYAEIKIVQPKLILTKIAPEEVLLCDPIPVRFVVTNSGTGSAHNVRIVETLPPGLRTSEGKSELVFDAGTLMAGQSQQFSTELQATKAGRYAGKAVASSTTGLRAESPVTTTVVSLPVLAIRMTGPERLNIGRPVTYEITVTNESDVPAKDAAIEGTIPEGVTSVKATAGAKLSGSKLVWKFGTLAPNSSKNILVSYTPTKAGTLVNSATGTAYCAETVTSSMRTSVTGIPALLLEVVDVEDPIRVGSRATYVISVTNQGSAPATNIRIACDLEDYVRYVSSAGATAGAMNGTTVRFLPLGSLPPKTKVAWRVVVAALRPGDTRFKVILNADQLSRPVEENEATLLYE